MAFAINLSLILTSDRTLHTLNYLKENPMSWIDDAAKKARDEDDDRSRREKAYEQELSGLWNDLVSQIKQDIEKINQNKDLLDRRLGGDILRFVPESAGKFIIEKRTFPAMYLTVENHHKYIAAERETVTNGQTRRSSKTGTDRINIELDSNYNLFLSLAHEDAKPVSISQVSQRLLEPFFMRSQ